MKYKVHDFAVATQAQYSQEGQRGAIISAVSGMILPPLILLVLGSAVAWVLAGFRRERPNRA